MDLLVCYDDEEEKRELVYELFRLKNIETSYDTLTPLCRRQVWFGYTIYESGIPNQGYFTYPIQPITQTNVKKWFEHFNEKHTVYYRASINCESWILDVDTYDGQIRFMNMEEFHAEVADKKRERLYPHQCGVTNNIKCTVTDTKTGEVRIFDNNGEVVDNLLDGELEPSHSMTLEESIDMVKSMTVNTDPTTLEQFDGHGNKVTSTHKVLRQYLGLPELTSNTIEPLKITVDGKELNEEEKKEFGEELKKDTKVYEKKSKCVTFSKGTSEDYTKMLGEPRSMAAEKKGFYDK